jgi:hypothetical protein
MPVSRKLFVCLPALFLAAACEGSPHGFLASPTGPTPTGIGPAISSVAVAPVAPSAATITWTTDADSDSHVEFGPTEQYGSQTSAQGFVKVHAVALSGLKPGTPYHFRVRSVDQSGTLAVSGNHTFKTPDEGAAVDRSGESGSPGGGDNRPSISITAPSDRETVSGTVSVTAQADDDRGIANVQFKLDGADLGGIDDRKPYAVRWDTRAAGDGTHQLTAVVRDSAGNATTSATVTVSVRNGSKAGSGGSSPDPESPAAPAPSPEPPPSGSNSSWPNEPAGFRTRNDQSWDAVTGNGWSYRRRQSSKNDDIVSDSTAPESARNVLRIIFTPDMDRDSEPSVHWMTFGTNRPREIFTGWWMKLSPNWKASPAGGGKIAFLWPPDGEGQVYANIGGSGAPHRININTEWAPYGQKFWEPNVRTTSVTYDRWYRVEWYMRWETSPGAGDGIIRWWVNGSLNGDYRNVRFPDCCLQQFEFAPTLQNPPSSEQYMYIDHTYVSTP